MPGPRRPIAQARAPMPAPARRRRGPARPAVVVLAVVVLFAALLGLHALRRPTAVPPKRPAPPRLVVATASCTFVDTAGTTKDYVNEAVVPGRRLVADLYYPAFETKAPKRGAHRLTPARTRGPFPTVFFAPGYGIDPAAYGALLDAWVRAGFVVVGVEFPDASAAAVASIHGSFADEADMANEPADLVYLAQHVLAASSGGVAGCAELRGMVDASALGLAGQSDGATVAAMLAFDASTAPGAAVPYRALGAKLGFKSVVVLSGQAYGDDVYGPPLPRPPALLVQSATDTCNTPAQSVDLYATLEPGARWFLALRDADHLTPYEGQDRPGFAVVSRVTTAFLAATLAGRVPGSSFLSSGNSSPSVATLVAGADPPSWLDASLGSGGVGCYRT